MTKKSGADRKTALRDIDFLRKRKKRPIDLGGKRRGYFLTGRVVRG